METMYALMTDDIGPPCAMFEMRADAERHLAELSEGLYEIEEVPFYAEEEQPVKTVWYRAGTRFGHPAPWDGVYEQTHWDWYRGAPLSAEDDGVIHGREQGIYGYCESYDREVAQRAFDEIAGTNVA